MDADDTDRLDVLVSVDQGGACVLSAFGVFQVRGAGDYRCRPLGDIQR